MGLYEDRLAAAQKEWPRLKVVSKEDSLLMNLLAWVLKNILRTGDDFMSRFITTVGFTIYVPAKWTRMSDLDRFFMLEHELVHVHQMTTLVFPRWLWPANMVLFAIAYTLLLPAFWTMRAKFEREAYTRQISLEVEHGRFDPTDPAQVQWMLNWLVPLFSGPSYFWMWTEEATRDYFTRLFGRLAAGDRF